MTVSGPLVYVMDMADRIVCKLCPFVAGGIFIGSVYWTAVTYGAVTVMQVGAEPTLTCRGQYNRVWGEVWRVDFYPLHRH